MKKDYVESLLKRFLKRKIKITSGLITAFLITGSACFALSVTEDKLTNNTWTNDKNNTIEESVGIDISKVSYKVIDIINNGTISVTNNDEKQDGYSALFATSPHKTEIFLGNIKNTGIISSYSGNKTMTINGFYNGNGIGIANAWKYVELGNIDNSGIISGIVGNHPNGLTYSGNGILLGLRNPTYYTEEAYIKIGNITNSGSIKGKAGNMVHVTEVVGNGIGIFIANDKDRSDCCVADSSIGNINNSGEISGIVESSLTSSGNYGKTMVSGNGIGVSLSYERTNQGTISGNFNIGELTNTGIIYGEHKQILSYFGNDSAFISGNGIGVITIGFSNYGDYGNLNLKRTINHGIINGSVSTMQASGFVVGNGIGFHGKNINLTDSLSNIGVIKGNIKRLSNDGTNLGNGLGISANYGGLNLKAIENIGVISGIIEQGNLKNGTGTVLGNGIGLEGDFINLTDISNNGFITGNLTLDKNSGENLGNGIGITSSKGDVVINDIENTGVIDGNVEGNIIKGSAVGNGIGIYGKNIQIHNIENEGKIKGTVSDMKNDNLYGNGLIISADNNLNITSITNKGTITGNNVGLNISKNNIAGELTNYSNGGIIAGKIPIYAQEFTNNLSKSADKGIAIQLDNNGNIESITNGSGGELDGKIIINADIKEKDSFISIDKETTYTNNIINGAGINNGTLSVNNKTTINNSIINAYENAITDSGNSHITINNSNINGIINLGKGNSTIKLTDSKLNGDILGGEGNDKLTIGGFNAYYNINGFENILFQKNTTLYETAKVTGANRIEIDSGTEVNLRIDSSKKAEDGTYKEHALFNSSDKLLTLAGNTNTITKDDVDENGNLSIEENEGRVNYDKVSILNLITNGLGLKSKIDLGNTKIEDTLWVKTDSILTQAAKEETKKGTIITIEAEKDLFNIIKKFDESKPDSKPETPLTPLEPAKPIKPEKPINIKYYTKLNDIYKGIYTSGDENFKALNNIVTNYTFGDKDKGDYPIIGNEKMQMATLLGYLREVYEETPYSFSHEATKKSMELFQNTIKDNNFKAKKDEYLIYGGLVHQTGDQEQTYYGKNYHGFDTGTENTKADIKLTGAYGQFEYGYSNTLSTGLIIGGTTSNIEISSSKLEGTGAYAGIYAKKDIKDFRITAGLGYQYTEYDGTRRIINENYSENYKDNGLNLYFDGKYSYKLEDNLYLEPKLGLSYTHIKQDNIKENKDKNLALDINSKEFDILEGTAGISIRKIIPTDKGNHSLSTGILYKYIFNGDKANSLTADFGGKDFDILIPHKNDEILIEAKYEVILENEVFYNIKGNYSICTDSKENSNKNKNSKEWRMGIGVGYKFTI